MSEPFKILDYRAVKTALNVALRRKQANNGVSDILSSILFEASGTVVAANWFEMLIVPGATEPHDESIVWQPKEKTAMFSPVSNSWAEYYPEADTLRTWKGDKMQQTLEGVRQPLDDYPDYNRKRPHLGDAMPREFKASKYGLFIPIAVDSCYKLMRDLNDDKLYPCLKAGRWYQQDSALTRLVVSTGDKTYKPTLEAYATLMKYDG